jgi:biotin transport system substrate-specific component
MYAGILTRSASRPLTRSRSLRIAFWVSAFTLATALSAQVRIPLPFTPVPVTLQTFFVLLSGLILGPWALLAQGLYLIGGAAGLPVFTAGGAGLSHLSGATTGYLLAFPLAGLFCGLIGPRSGRLRTWLVTLGAALFILVLGTAWLAALTHTPPAGAAVLGFWPFLAGDMLKAAAAAGLGRRIGRRL